MPGGAVDGDESLHDAARREVEEELGSGMSPGRLLVVDWGTATTGLLHMGPGSAEVVEAIDKQLQPGRVPGGKSDRIVLECPKRGAETAS